MKIPFGIAGSVLLLLFTYMQTEPVQSQSSNCSNKTNCAYGTAAQSPQQLLCSDVLAFVYILLPTCYEYFGRAMNILPNGYAALGLFQSPYKICDYYTPETTVVTCLYANGTSGSRLCSYAVELVSIVSLKCTEFYELFPDEFPQPGKEAIEYRNDPNNKCRASVTPGECTKNGSPSAELCPNCIFESCG